MLLKTKHRAAIYSTGEIWGFESACSVSNHIIAERWRHARTKVTPQVLKSSIAAPPIPSFFYLIIFTSRLHSSSPSVHLRRFAPHHLLFWSPVKWSLRPVLSPDHLPSRRSVSLALFLIVCLVFHSLSLSIYLLFLCSSGCLFSHRLSVLSSCHLPTRFSSFFDPPRVFLAFHHPLPFLPHRFSIKRPVLLSSAPFSCGSSSSSDAIISDLISIMPFYILHFYSEMTETWLLNITSVKERLQRPFMVNLFLGFLPKQPALLENIIANLISCFEVY